MAIPAMVRDGYSRFMPNLKANTYAALTWPKLFRDFYTHPIPSRCITTLM